MRFTDQQAAVLNAVADTLIPPAEGWAVPSEVDIVHFAGRYVTPSGYRNKHYPFATEDEFKACACRDCQRSVSIGARPALRVDALI